MVKLVLGWILDRHSLWRHPAESLSQYHILVLTVSSVIDPGET